MASTGRPTVAVIVPVWTEPDVDRSLERLPALFDELIVVEAGDLATATRLNAFVERRADSRVRLLRAPRGRARQMNAGARAARSDVLLFLHADTLLPDGGLDLVRDAVARGAIWGRFDVRLSGAQPVFRLIERMMNWRSALTGVATGDQAMFVRRDAFAMLGGFASIALMEDVELCSRLKWIARPCRLREPVVTSTRRWERQGIARTVVRMWILRGLYAFGVSPTRLARWYN